jgi:hypothetical protein
MIPLIASLALGAVSSAEAAGLAGPDQTIAQGLPVLLGDPAKSGTDPGDTDPGAVYHWRQIILSSEPYVKLSHIDKTTTMLIAPEVVSPTAFRFGLARNGVESTVDITVVPLAADSPSNTTFIDSTISPATCTTYDPATRACGSGSYHAQKSTFNQAFFPSPAAGWRYVWRAGTYQRPNDGFAGHPQVRIEGTNAATGTATAPVQFKVYKNGSTYESVVLTLDPADVVIGQIWVAGSSYVIVEGFEITGAPATGNAGMLVTMGGCCWGDPSPDYTAAPSHHVTVRHVVAHDHGASGTFRGAFAIFGPSHEIAYQYDQAYNDSAGFEIGIEQSTVRSNLPYNIFLHTVIAHDNYRHPGNSENIEFAGARNTACYRCVAYRGSDCGMCTQGPFTDSNVWWDSVAFRMDSDLSPLAGLLGRGNERGMQLSTINPDIATTPPFPRAGAYNRLYNVRIYDNKGNGLNLSGGGVDDRAYHLTVFNNCLRNTGPWAGIGIETYAGTGHYPGSPAPGATVENTISYHNTYGCIGTQGDFTITSYAAPYTTLMTNLPNGNPSSAPLDLTTSPGFVVATPSLGAMSAVTTDISMYIDVGTRTVNPRFGAVAGLALQASSVAIDAGTFVPGIHCDRADDGAIPYPIGDPNCIHWTGVAPDVGAYESGIGIAASPPPGAPYGLQVR